MELQTIWFGLIAVLWIGYFVLEGFDFGVGILLRAVGKTEAERRAIVTTLGPLWDGNEVWVLVAGGATFAAFPEWYATLFSGFYLPLLLILVALIVRGVAFEYRSKRSSLTWRKRWDWAIFVGSAVPALLWGVAFANIVRGVPLEPATSDYGNIVYTGGFFNLLNPYALIGGLTTLTLFLTHGAVFLALKTTDPIKERGHAIATKAGLVGLARSLARELGSRSITVNVVAPGPVATDMTAALGEDKLRAMADMVPLQRVAQPDEIAGVITFLASPDAAYITGAVIPVDGGLGMGH